MFNILTIDLEDYYMVSAFEGVVKRDDWDKYESRIERNTHRLSPFASNLSSQTSRKGTLMRNEILASVDESIAEIDWFGVLGDERIGRYFEIGCEVKGLRRGHVKQIKDQVEEEKERMLMEIPLEVTEKKVERRDYDNTRPS
jgi:hypothetical protein